MSVAKKSILNEEAIKLIEGKNFGYLATIMEDGSPQVTPVWVDHEGDIVLVNTTAGKMKQRNIERNPKVAIVIPETKNPQIRVVIRGTAEQTTEGAGEHLDKLAKKYRGINRYPEERRVSRIILRITPEHVVFTHDIWSKEFHVTSYHAKNGQ